MRHIAHVIDAIITLKDQFSATLKNVNSHMTEFSKKANYMGRDITKTGKSLERTGASLTTSLTLPIVGMGIASAKAGMDFEAAMSKVKAISGATGSDFKQLNDLALKLGADTSFSASQAAEGMENLASAGFNVKEIVSAMPGMLDLAAAGGVQISEASDIAASSLRGFGLEANAAGHVADVLAKAAADTNAGISDMGLALKYAAPPSHALGLSLEEVSAAIGIMANSGIKADMAGTTIRGALTRLSSPSKEAATMMANIGFKAFDSHGKMLPLAQVIGNLQKSTSKLTDEQKQNAIATIFGQETMSGMLTLVQAGPAEMQKLTDGFKKSTGAAKDMAKTMQDNGKGSIEQMMGSLETAGIKISQILAPSIKKIADRITELANKFSNLNPKTQEFIIKTLGIVAITGPIILFVGKITLSIGNLITGFSRLSKSITNAGGIMAWLKTPGNFVVIAIVAIITIIAVLYVAWTENWGNIQGKTKAFTAAIKKEVDTFVTDVKEAWKRFKEFLEHPITATVKMVKEGPSVSGTAISGAGPQGLAIDSGAGHNALGTNYWKGGLSYVNEGNRGELIDLPNGSRVIPHDLSKKMLSGNISIEKLADQIIVREEADIDKIATALVSKLNEHAFNM